MANKMNLKIITPDKILIDEEVDAVYSKAVDGDIGILPNHIDYMTALDIGVTLYKQDNCCGCISIIGGILQINNNNVTILSDKAELGSEIDLTRANAAKERAEARLKLEEVKDVDHQRAQIALLRAIARISAASQAHKL